MGSASMLRGRLLLAAGAAAIGVSCTPRTPPEGTPNQEQTPLPSPSAATSAPSASATTQASTTASASAAPPAEIASATPSTSASAVEIASATPQGKTIPFPAEPHCFGGPCAERQVCTKASGKPLPFGLPAPFQGCASSIGRGTFSKMRSETQRKATPDVCCYVELQRPMRGRLLYIGQQATEVALVSGGTAWG